jgi:hypothetical protein
VVGFVSFVLFMLFFNELTRGLFGFLVFYYAFGAVLSFAGQSNQYTMVYEVVRVVADLLWKDNR